MSLAERSGTLLLLILFGVALSLWEGVAIYFLWGWFVVPLGVVSITISHAAGIALAIGIAAAQTPRKQTPEESVYSLKHAFLRPVIALAIGYPLHLVMTS